MPDITKEDQEVRKTRYTFCSWLQVGRQMPPLQKKPKENFCVENHASVYVY